MKKQPKTTSGPVKLRAPRQEALQKISLQEIKGRHFLSGPIPNENALKEERFQADKWHDFNVHLLSQLFESDSIALEYSEESIHFGFGDPSLEERVEFFRDDIRRRMNRLQSIVERLELFPEISANAGAFQADTRGLSNKVFVVHGHDEAAREMVARFLEKLSLEPIILHEQPNTGRTIIEKVETYSDVCYAVILLTPDDFGGKIGRSPKNRARQNVILELGYFIGKLGRSRVCTLVKDEVETPSDFDGVVYNPLDAAGAWRLLLARELKTVGLDFDLNKAV